MRVAITGATGFLGGALAAELVRAGAEVHALCRRTSDRARLDGVPVTWHEGDVLEPASLAPFVAGSDLVVHAAGRLGEAGAPEGAYVAANVDGTRNVMAAALSASRRPRVLHLSSPGVLGPTSDPAPEDAPYGPTNAYERSKVAAEGVAREFAGRGLHVILARPGFIYGPGDRHVLGLFRAISSGRFFLVDGGRHLCQPTFVADAVAGMLACARRGRAGEAYHLVGPRAVTFRDLGEAIAVALGVPAPRVSLPRWSAMLAARGLEVASGLAGRRPPVGTSGIAFFSEDRVVSSQKARRELGYSPTHDVDEGAALTVAWYRQRGWL